MPTNEVKLYFPKDLPQDKTVLIFAPHPDDTSISAGGVSVLLAHHNKVVSVIMTTGHRAEIADLNRQAKIALREKESIEEAKILGTSVEFLKLDLYDGKKITKEDRQKLTTLLETHRPELIFLPNLKDPHPTHHLCTQLVLQTVKQFTELHTMNIDLWHYEGPWSLFDREDFNAIVSLDPKTFEQKLKAIRAHKSQNDRTRYDVIASSLAQMRAAIVGEQNLGGYGGKAPQMDPFAELFTVVKVGHQSKLVESFSGIRGIFRQGLTPEVARDYGFVYGSWLKHTLHVNPKVVVGMDTRSSGPMLKRGLIEGLNRAHCHIFDVGVATTPMVQFEVRNRKCDGGVILTASHNEPEWNGFKFLWNDGSALSSESMKQVITSYHTEVRETETPYADHYIRFLTEWFGEPSIEKIRKANLKVVVDPNGGAIIVVLKKLFGIFGITTVDLNMAPGAFAHTIEPTIHSLKHLAPVIEKEKADFGVAWDCDGDRLEIMLPNGSLISGHYILALLVDQILRKTKGVQTVVVNAATSGVVAEVAKRYGAHVIETDVGEANVVSQMKITNAVVGGEGANGGGIIPPSRCRDGLMTLLKIMELMVEQKKSLPALLDSYPKYYTRQANISVAQNQIDILHKAILSHFKEALPQTIGEQGGVKLKWPDNTFLWFRESKTEKNIVRLLVDSSHRIQTDTLFNAATQLLEKLGNPTLSTRWH